MVEPDMNPEQRKSLRLWSDYIHRIFTAIILALLVWLINTTNENDKGYSNLVIQMEANQEIFQTSIIELQRQQNDLQKQHSRDIADILNKMTVIQELRVRIASQHYTKLEVRDLVDRTTKPILEKLDKQSEKLDVVLQAVK